ncbi:unnamed protein product [Prorocentrum cordatum]|uniref:Uncharacterized protein n=1 Tax=Prorocentrum cordatum TaxID=2364126 RepID=A0ABN9WFS3_9DINO|nr:unnamed protein product [Polarella glacialis]
MYRIPAKACPCATLRSTLRKLHPLGILRDGLCYAVPETANLLLQCARFPIKFGSREFMSAHASPSLCICASASACSKVPSVRAPLGIWTKVPAGLHEVEALADDVLQVRVANARDGAACWPQ